jgi:hypothetical protein
MPYSPRLSQVRYPSEEAFPSSQLGHEEEREPLRAEMDEDAKRVNEVEDKVCAQSPLRYFIFT